MEDDYKNERSPLSDTEIMVSLDNMKLPISGMKRYY
jgi:hypothetical protein